MRSEKGLLAEAPHGQRENAGLPVSSYLLPAASTISTTPLGSSTRKGPFLRTVIVTCDMEPPVKMTSFQTIAQEEKLPPANNQRRGLLWEDHETRYTHKESQ